MGFNDQGGFDARPPHNVTIGQPFAVSKFEVTFSEWAEFCASSQVTLSTGRSPTLAKF